jgi:hypothetical protein
MSALIIRVRNAHRQPLTDQMDVHVVSSRTDSTVARVLRVPGNRDVRVEKLIAGQPYIVKVFATRHRPVGLFAMPKDGEDVVVEVFTPLDPERVAEAKFPEYDALPPELRAVLERSEIEGVDGPGAPAYASLTDMQRAGLFNLFAKMTNFGFDEQRTAWSFVDGIYRVRPDRIFVDVQPALRDLVKGAVAGERFREVSGKLHVPPAGFVGAGSFKTAERYGNLQLSFFASLSEPLTFKVDADIDDAAGLGHAFQVLRNFVTHGVTHPYDIHQILVFRQEVALPYDLA